MSVASSITKIFVPVHREGYRFIAIFAGIALALYWLWPPLGFAGLVLTVWCAYFFRDPPRVTPAREGLVISPADGRIETVGLALPPPELGLGDQPLPRVSVFMSVFDCHVNRSPVGGKIKAIHYRPGLFLNADLDKASEDNERNGLVIEGAYGSFGVVQIAGLIARRIVCFAKPGDPLGPGERFGLIRFGSRVDVYFPAGARPAVGVGQRAIAGETVLCDMKSVEPPRSFSKA